MKRQTGECQTVRLSAGQAYATRATRGTRIGVDSGRAWLTVERDLRDFVLKAGGVFDCEADDALVVVEMLAPGALAISGAPRGTTLPARRHGWIARLRQAFRPTALSLCNS